jgi:hypothetical protein
MQATNHSLTDDLLKIFDSITIQKDNVIPEQDLKFCEQQQELLYESLDRIQHWYGIFREEAEKFAESHVLSYKADGTLKFQVCYRDHYNNASPDYKKFDFTPFQAINSLVENRKNAISAFAGNIIRYFNSKYSISMPIPEIGEKLSLDFRPVYTGYTSLVEQHLNGRGFRETAEEELINRFHALVFPYRSSSPPQVKNDKMIFQNLLRITESYHSSQPAHRIEYGHDGKLDTLCEGILFGGNSVLTGSSSIIRDFNYQKMDITQWYPLTFETGYAIKFYKNGRVDVRFPDAAQAKKCYERLRLNELTTLINQ